MTDDGPIDPFDPTHMTAMLAQMVDTLRLLAESAAGYRALLVGQGFPDEMAQGLAMDYLRRMQAKALPLKEGD